MRSISWTAVASAVVYACTGCATYTSDVARSAHLDEGLVYYLPRKDVVVTVTVSADATSTSVGIDASAAYADRSRAFLLRYQRSPIAKNVMDIGVTAGGLLSSASATSTVQLDQALASIANLAGMSGARGFAMTPAPAEKCALPGTYVFSYPLEPEPNGVVGKPCGISVSISRVADARVVPARPEEPGARAGIYYRQLVPYRVKASGGASGIAKETIVFSPTGSPDLFLPLSRNLFANNESTLTLVEGALTGYKQDSDGELVALLKLPAAIISAYFAAAGSLFDAFSTRDSKEAAALTSAMKLELERLKYQACLAAVRNKDDEAIKSLGCGA